MPAKCGPPKSQRVKGYYRKAKAKRRRKRKTTAPKGPYWVCVNRSGRTCGSHHRTFTGAVKHRKQLDRAARISRARYGGPLNDWDIARRGR